MANPNFTCTLNAWRSGQILYANMTYTRTDGLTYTYQDSSFPDPTMDLGAGVVYTDTAFGNAVRDNGVNIGTYTSPTYSRTVAGSGQRTVTWTAGTGLRSDFAGTWTASVDFPASTAPPSGLNITIAEVYKDGAKFNVSVSSYGSPDSVSGRWIEAGILGQNRWESPSLRSDKVTDTTSAVILVNNDSVQTTTLTIQPNTQYYYGMYAWNTQLSDNTIAGQFVTLPAEPTISLASFTSTSMTVAYTVPADGGFYTRTLKYSVDGGAWVTVDSFSGTTGTFTVSGLSVGQHTIRSMVSTIAGDSLGNSISTHPESVLYGSDNAQAHRITALYASRNEVGDFRMKGDTEQNGTPTPDSTVPVQTVTGRQVVEVYGKNLLNLQTATTTNGRMNLTISEPVVNYNFTSISGTGSGLVFDVDIKQGRTYTIKATRSTGVANNNVRISNGDWDTEGAYQGVNVANTFGNGATFTANSNYTKLRIWINNSNQSGANTGSISYIQLEEGSSATSYESHQSYEVNLGNIELCKIASASDAPSILTYRDYIYKENGNWYLHKEITKAVFNGSEAWSAHNTYNNIQAFRFYSNAAHSNSAILADLYYPVYITTYNSGTRRTYGMIATLETTTTATNDTIFMTAPNSSVTTLAQFKAWLAANPVTAYYALATPTDAQITDAGLIAQLEAIDSADSYGDTTVLKATGNLSAELSANFISASRILKLYGSVNGQTKLIYQERR